MLKENNENCGCDMIVENACDCNNTGAVCEYFGTMPLPERTVVTMAYIPFQTDTTMYDFETALENGTAYPVLNKPFLGGKCI